MKGMRMSASVWRVAAMAAAVALLSGCAAKTAAPVRDATQPPPAVPTTAATSGTVYHVVRQGDTLMALSRMYGASVADLVAWNGLSNPNQIVVGQQLRVAPPAGAVAQAMAIPDTTDLRPLAPAAVDAGPPTFDAPRGGRQPYSDQAWAALGGQAQQQAALPPPSTPATTPEAAAASGAWSWPVASGPILLGFDQPKGEDGKLTNKGIDIGGTPGTPVLAAASGTVMYAGSGLRGFGKLVIIRHESDYQTVYAHNQQLLVKEGDTVARGQQVAELGSTDADKPMLHFEIRRQGRPLDPLQYLPAR